MPAVDHPVRRRHELRHMPAQLGRSGGLTLVQPIGSCSWVTVTV